MQIKIHPSVYTSDPLTEIEQLNLERSIQSSQGAKMPVLLWHEQGKDFDWLMDGLHRYTICNRLNLPFATTYAPGDESDAIALAASVNNDRRHRTLEQIAFAAARYATNGRGRPTNPPAGGINPAESNPPAGGNSTGQPDTRAKTTAEAAKDAGASIRSVERAKVVLSKGTPELQAAVNAGSISLSDAEQLSREPAEAQNAALNDVVSGNAKTATGAAKTRRAQSKNGRITFDDSKGEAKIGELTRFFTARKNAMGDSPRYAQIKQLMLEVFDVYTAWKGDSTP